MRIENKLSVGSLVASVSTSISPLAGAIIDIKAGRLELVVALTEVVLRTWPFMMAATSNLSLESEATIVKFTFSPCAARYFAATFALPAMNCVVASPAKSRSGDPCGLSRNVKPLSKTKFTKFCDPAATVIVAYTPLESLTALSTSFGWDDALGSRNPNETRIPCSVAFLIALTSVLVLESWRESFSS